MSNPAITIVPLPEERFDEAAALLTRAFIDDPLFISACPDPVLRARWMPLSFRWSLWHGLFFGDVLGTPGRLDGVVAYFGLGTMTPEQTALSGYAGLHGADAMSDAERRLDAIFDPIHERLIEGVPERHWYLDVIAVDPDRQGLGVGGALLRAIGERADDQAIPVLLMTMQERAVPLYQRHGFTITHHDIDPTSGLPWWGFRREPEGGSR